MNDALRRFNTINIHIIGGCTVLVLILALYFLGIKPKTEDIAKVQADAKSTEDAGGTDEKVAGSQRDLKRTLVLVADTKAKWQVNQLKYMPAEAGRDSINLTSGDLLQTYENQLINIPAEWGRFVTAWYDAQTKMGVERAPGIGFPVDAFPADPNYISTISSLKFPQGGAWPVTLYAKSFDQAMAHLRRFNDMEKHGMPVIDNVSLSGQSPNLQMTYSLALYVILDKAPPASDPSISTGTGAAAGGGGYSGMMGGGGMPGMPPGMMGGGGMPPGMAGGRRGPAMAGGGAGGGKGGSE